MRRERACGTAPGTATAAGTAAQRVRRSRWGAAGGAQQVGRSRWGAAGAAQRVRRSGRSGCGAAGAAQRAQRVGRSGCGAAGVAQRVGRCRPSGAQQAQRAQQQQGQQGHTQWAKVLNGRAHIQPQRTLQCCVGFFESVHRVGCVRSSTLRHLGLSRGAARSTARGVVQRTCHRLRFTHYL